MTSTAPPGVESPPAGYAGRPRDAQLEYKAILANASIGIAFTRDRKFTLCNPKFAEMLGWKAEELIGQPGEAVYPSRESYEAMGGIAVPLLSSGRQLDVEWEMRRKDGSTFLARLIAKAVSAADTQRGTVWIIEDITDRKRHADEVARLLREQNAILDTASIGICFVRDRAIVRCNRRMEEMYGFAPGELNGKPTSVAYAAESDYVLATESYAEMARGQTHTHVMQAKRRDGTVFWERSTGRAMDPGDPARGSVWLLEDITEQKRAEEELQRVLSEQQAIANNVLIGIAFLRERKIVRCNRRFEELFGYGAGEVLNMSTRQYYFTDEEFEASGRFIAEIEAGKTPSMEQWLRRRDGSGFWCRVRPQTRPAEGPIWLFEDITERKRADEVRRMARAGTDLVTPRSASPSCARRDQANRYFEDARRGARRHWQHRPLMAVARGRTDTTEPPGPRRSRAARTTGEAPSSGMARCRRPLARAYRPGGAAGWIWSVEDVTVERARRRRAPSAGARLPSHRPHRLRAQPHCRRATRASSRCSTTARRDDRQDRENLFASNRSQGG